MSYSIRQLSMMAGVSRRTLRYYDKIGLLTPMRQAENGYRRYGEEELLRLQQILFYRQMSLSLQEIHSILDQPDFDVLTALEQHRKSLLGRQAQIAHLVDTVNRTILYLKGRTSMESNELFSGFSEEQQKRYEDEIQAKYGSEKLDESKRNWGSIHPRKNSKFFKRAARFTCRSWNPCPLVQAAGRHRPGSLAGTRIYVIFTNPQQKSC